jgi:carbamoyl-phosphate synthase small subunit
MSYCGKGKGYLYLEDGTLMEGCAFGAHTTKSGEVVFTTAMNGYPESLTDPSYRGQILTITHPLIGNYGVPAPKFKEGVLQNFESERIQAEGLIVQEETEGIKWNSSMSLHHWLTEQGVPGLSRIDTRSLVKKVRDRGVMMGIISHGSPPSNTSELTMKRYDDMDLVSLVSPINPIIHEGKGKELIVVVDCGVKHGILRSLQARGVTIVRLPCNFTAEQIMDYSPKGIIFSNGPGNPKLLVKQIRTFKSLTEYKVPILGICLGHQIGVLSMDGDVEKMKFGHRGINKGVVDIKTNRFYISTHNHGYALHKTTIPSSTEVWFYNVDDGIVEGLKHRTLPIITVQFHPEAGPGPWDTEWIFDYFLKMVSKNGVA